MRGWFVLIAVIALGFYTSCFGCGETEIRVSPTIFEQAISIFKIHERSPQFLSEKDVRRFYVTKGIKCVDKTTFENMVIVSQFFIDQDSRDNPFVHNQESYEILASFLEFLNRERKTLMKKARALNQTMTTEFRYIQNKGEFLTSVNVRKNGTVFSDLFPRFIGKGGLKLVISAFDLQYDDHGKILKVWPKVEIVSSTNEIRKEWRVYSDFENLVESEREGIAKAEWLVNSKNKPFLAQDRCSFDLYKQFSIMTELNDPLSKYIHLLRAVATSLRNLHALNWIHGDFKLTNVLFCNNKPLLIDFGMAFKPEDLVPIQSTPGFESVEMLDERDPPEDESRDQYLKSRDIFSFGMSALKLSLSRHSFKFFLLPEDICPFEVKDTAIALRRYHLTNYRKCILNAFPDFYENVKNYAKTSCSSNNYGKYCLEDIILNSIDADPMKRLTAEELEVRLMGLERVLNN